MQVTAPERSHAQRLSALEEANRIRTHRAYVKVALGDGRLTLQEVMADPDCQTMKVSILLLALPKVGRTKAEGAMKRAGVSPSKTVGGLTLRQRDILWQELSRHAWLQSQLTGNPFVFCGRWR